MERFWSKVSIKGRDECWEWKAHRDEKGYGRFWVNGVMGRAHRFALSTVIPEPKKKSHAMHSCDNPSCCNPSHLSWGNHKQNSDDKVSKDRHIRGETHPNSVFTNEIVDGIIRMKMDGFNVHEISSSLGLTKGGVMNVYIGRAWKHRHGIDGNPTIEEMRNRKPDRRIKRT